MDMDILFSTELIYWSLAAAGFCSFLFFFRVFPRNSMRFDFDVIRFWCDSILMWFDFDVIRFWCDSILPAEDRQTDRQRTDNQKKTKKLRGRRMKLCSVKNGLFLYILYFFQDVEVHPKKHHTPIGLRLCSFKNSFRNLQKKITGAVVGVGYVLIFIWTFLSIIHVIVTDRQTDNNRGRSRSWLCVNFYMKVFIYHTCYR